MWHSTKPQNPAPGDAIMDSVTGNRYIWTGVMWADFSDCIPESPVPTQVELEKYPALKNAWEEFLIIKKTIGK